MANEPRETRVHGSFLAASEKKVLIWIAERLPRWVNSDHLTSLGAVALAAAGICYWMGRQFPAALVAVVILLAVNWFGDSLDGTLARVRHQERPRYGFYVDHVLDALGILFLMAGLMAGGYMSLAVGAGFLIAYYLLTIEIALATHALGTFRLSVLEDGSNGAAHPSGCRHAGPVAERFGRHRRPSLAALRCRLRRRHRRPRRDFHYRVDRQCEGAVPEGTDAEVGSFSSPSTRNLVTGFSDLTTTDQETRRISLSPVDLGKRLSLKLVISSRYGPRRS